MILNIINFVIYVSQPCSIRLNFPYKNFQSPLMKNTRDVNTLKRYQKEQQPSWAAQRAQRTQRRHIQHYGNVVELLESMFSDNFIYNNARFKALVQADRRGYVNISQLMNESTFIQFAQRNSLVSLSPREIAEEINTSSKKLISRNLRVRRLVPFEDKIQSKIAKPVYIDSYPKQMSMDQIKSLLEQYVPIYQIYTCRTEQWIIVFTDKYETLQQLHLKQLDNGIVLSISNSWGTYNNYSGYQKLCKEHICRKIYDNKQAGRVYEYLQDYKMAGEDQLMSKDQVMQEKLLMHDKRFRQRMLERDAAKGHGIMDETSNFEQSYLQSLNMSLDIPIADPKEELQLIEGMEARMRNMDNSVLNFLRPGAHP